jgi:hypothetical protein
VVGLGDHVPAFLLREVRPPKKRTGADADSDDVEDGSSEDTHESEAA